MSIVFKRLNDPQKVPRAWTILGSFFQILRSLSAGTLSLFPLVYFHHWVQCLAGCSGQIGTSLVVQWLRLHASTAGGIGMTLCWRTKILPATQCNQKKKKKSRQKNKWTYSRLLQTTGIGTMGRVHENCCASIRLPCQTVGSLIWWHWRLADTGWDSHIGKDIWLDSVILPSNSVAGPLPWSDRWKISSQEHSLQAGKQGFNAYLRKRKSFSLGGGTIS